MSTSTVEPDKIFAFDALTAAKLALRARIIKSFK